MVVLIAFITGIIFGWWITSMIRELSVQPTEQHVLESLSRTENLEDDQEDVSDCDVGYDEFDKMLQECLEQWTRIVWEVADDKGWWSADKLKSVEEYDPTVVASLLALVHSEISEALEEVRTEKWGITYAPYTDKPEGFAIELADACIRIFDLCFAMNINLGEAIVIKTKYNEKRPFRHGDKAL